MNAIHTDENCVGDKAVRKMTKEDMLTIQRQLGIIEGIALAIGNTKVGGIFDATECISRIMDKEAEDGSEIQVD